MKARGCVLAMQKGLTQRNALGRIIGARALTDQQERYVRRYTTNGGDAEEAATHAGYSIPKQDAWRLMKNATVRSAISASLSGEIEACLAMSTTLLRRRLASALASDEEIDMDTLRKVIGTLASRVLPSPKPLDEQAHSADDVSIDDLETALQELKRQRSDAALVIEGSATPMGTENDC